MDKEFGDPQWRTFAECAEIAKNLIDSGDFYVAIKALEAIERAKEKGLDRAWFGIA